MKKAILLSALLFGASANALVIDFSDSTDGAYGVPSIISGGFVFTDFINGTNLGTEIVTEDDSASNGTLHLANWVNGFGLAGLQMNAVDDGLFTLESFDFASGYVSSGNFIADSLAIEGFDVNGNSVASALFTPGSYSSDAFSTLSLSTEFTNLSFVTFTTDGTFNRGFYDNITVDSLQVPEPSAFSVFLIGLAALGFRHRKAKK